MAKTTTFNRATLRVPKLFVSVVDGPIMAVGRHVLTTSRAPESTQNVVKMWFCLCMFLCVANAFNLEPRIPVYKLGDKDSYFGYSVAEHQILDSNGKSVREHV